MQLTPLRSKSFKIYYLSEKALTLEFGNEINEGTSLKINRFHSILKIFPFEGLLAVVPAYTTLSIFYDPVTVIGSKSLSGLDCFERISDYLVEIESKDQEIETREGEMISIPVYYGGEQGPDLQAVAEHTKLSPEEIISLHSSAAYRVYMIGFTPGFAYLGGMPEQLATPRKTTPARAVSAGSVGIAGVQTGIYPLTSPGGWQIIGQTPLKLFDANRSNPTLVKAGDTVKFSAVSLEEFNHLKQS
ncbi:5-oxoprolinase subunit PxpB [Desertivirga brevis]|uniref:5-oxoprolinase subunit PxpB n=1 Tax=Desertivirga brevis TaxID=2810310 RepID=UPI001A975F3E|nr:5-oxoprolinase subunit PxpB [Pedobacter sp. SYSU D00873]